MPVHELCGLGQSLICLYQVFVSADSFKIGNLVAVDVFGVVLFLEPLEVSVDYFRVERAIVLKLEQLVGLERAHIRQTVLLVLDFDQVVGVDHPLADIADEHPLRHPSSIAQVESLLLVYALVNQVREADKDEQALYGKDSIQDCGIMLSKNIVQHLYSFVKK